MICRLWGAVWLSVLLLGCGDDSSADTGARDTGDSETGGRDMGSADSATRDTGEEDSGSDGADTSVDTDEPDGGTEPGRFFADGAFFHRDVSGSAPAEDSDAIITSLRNAGGWGNSDRFQIDFSIEVLEADGDTPVRAFETTDDFFSPDCDNVPMPVPSDGNLEGESGYQCESDGDCHLIVWAPEEQRLYEMWRANIVGETFFGGCLAVWDTSRVYDDSGRGDQCTSADAAGFPIAPLLFTADEVAAGEINHAIRFILPNDRVRMRRYVPPATHGTNTSGDDAAPAYGVHFRLRADYPLDELPNEAARTVARALQRYGMYHADGGNIALTARSDERTTAKWEDLLGPRDLAALQVEDFEVIDHGPAVEVTFECDRTPLSE